MNEIIIAGGVEYAAQDVTTSVNTISFKLSELTADAAREAFNDVETLAVGNGTDNIYGEYPNVKFLSVTLAVDGSITVTMHILSETEKQIRELQEAQTKIQTSVREHDEIIAELLYGGGEA